MFPVYRLRHQLQTGGSGGAFNPLKWKSKAYHGDPVNYSKIECIYKKEVIDTLKGIIIQDWVNK